MRPYCGTVDTLTSQSKSAVGSYWELSNLVSSCESRRLPCQFQLGSWNRGAKVMGGRRKVLLSLLVIGRSLQLCSKLNLEVLIILSA